MEKIVSMMTEPPMTMLICMPMTVSTGISEFFSAWRRITVPSRRPFARAVRM